MKEGLHQYYEIEQTTDLWSLNSGRVQAKIGVNTKDMPNKTPVSLAVIDNKHLNENGICYFCALSKQFLREKLIDYIDIVVAPVLIRGMNSGRGSCLLPL